jgi:hypothetical protein
VPSFLLHRCEFRKRWDLKDVCRCSTHTTPRPNESNRGGL